MDCYSIMLYNENQRYSSSIVESRSYRMNMKDEGFTTIRVSHAVRDLLKNAGVKGESYSQVISRLLVKQAQERK